MFLITWNPTLGTSLNEVEAEAVTELERQLLQCRRRGRGGLPIRIHTEEDLEEKDLEEERRSFYQERGSLWHIFTGACHFFFGAQVGVTKLHEVVMI